jgi:hypothetical protein
MVLKEIEWEDELLATENRSNSKRNLFQRHVVYAELYKISWD